MLRPFTRDTEKNTPDTRTDIGGGRKGFTFPKNGDIQGISSFLRRTVRQNPFVKQRIKEKALG